jgi:hypothetical protein
MTISNSTSLLDSILTAQTAQQDVGVAVLKKAQDVAKQEGEAMVNMLEQIGPQAVAGRLDAYA